MEQGTEEKKEGEYKRERSGGELWKSESDLKAVCFDSYSRRYLPIRNCQPALSKKKKANQYCHSQLQIKLFVFSHLRALSVGLKEPQPHLNRWRGQISGIERERGWVFFLVSSFFFISPKWPRTEAMKQNT